MDSFTKLSVLLSLLLLSPFHSNAAPLSKPKTPPPLSKPITNNNGSLELLNNACSSITNKTFCMDYLKTSPKVMAATKFKPLDFALTLIQSAGVDEAKNVVSYLSKLPKEKLSTPQAIEAYKNCKNNWDGLASGLEVSIKNIREQGGYAYDTTDYELKVNLDKASYCNTGLNNAKIQDHVIAKGHEKVTIAVFGADAILVGVKPPKKLD